MNQLLQFIINLFWHQDTGDLADFPDPAEPDDLGSALTQDEIDFVKKLKKEIDERFSGDIPA
jgi:hypothetical protein